MNTFNPKDQNLTLAVTYTDKEEQYVMGIKYFFGDGVEENPKQGLKLLKQAATQRHLEAQFLLGQLFQMGFKTLQPNQEQAIRWYKLAAQQKHTEAQQILQNLGVLLKTEDTSKSVESQQPKGPQKALPQNRSFVKKISTNAKRIGQEKKPFNGLDLSYSKFVPHRQRSLSKPNTGLASKKGLGERKTVNSKPVLNPQKLLDDDLIKACRQGDIVQVKKALEKGANVNIIDQEGYTPLHYAARFGRAYIVQVLLEKNAETKRQDGGGNTAAHLALKNGHQEVIRLIRSHEIKNSTEFNNSSINR